MGVWYGGDTCARADQKASAWLSPVRLEQKAPRYHVPFHTIGATCPRKSAEACFAPLWRNASGRAPSNPRGLEQRRRPSVFLAVGFGVVERDFRGAHTHFSPNNSFCDELFCAAIGEGVCRCRGGLGTRADTAPSRSRTMRSQIARTCIFSHCAVLLSGR